jgi:hypothetical protein
VRYRARTMAGKFRAVNSIVEECILSNKLVEALSEE